MTPGQRIARLLLVGSLLITLVFPLVRSKNVFHTAGGRGTDLTSHWGSSILLANEGLALYRAPTFELCDHPAGPQLWKVPTLTCGVRGHPEIPAVLINWQEYPRWFPPGVQLVMAPFGAMYVAGVSLPSIDALAMVLMLVVMHVATYFLGRLFWRHEDRTVRVAGLAFVVFAHLQLITWSLNATIDPLPLAAIFAGVGWLRERRVVAAAIAFSVSCFLHYRSFWYVPLFVWTAVRVAETWPTLSRRAKWALGVAALGPISACATFALSWHAFDWYPVNNALHLSPPPTTYLVPSLVFCVLVARREWLLLASAAFQLAMLTQSREVRQWDLLFTFPLVAIAALGRRATIGVFAAIVMVIWQAEMVFDSHLFATEQLLNLFAD